MVDRQVDICRLEMYPGTGPQRRHVGAGQEEANVNEWMNEWMDGLSSRQGRDGGAGVSGLG